MNSLLQLYPGDRAVILAFSVVAQVTIVLLVTLLVTRRLSRNAAVRHAVLFLALGGVLLSPLTIYVVDRAKLSPFTVSSSFGKSTAALPVVDHPGGGQLGSPLLPLVNKAQHPPVSSLSPKLWNREEGGSTALVAERGVASREKFAEGIKPERASTVSATYLFRVAASAGLAVWLSGLLVLLVRLLHSWSRVAILCHDVRSIDTDCIEDVLQEVRDTLGTDKLPRIATSDRVGRPLAARLLRPVVIVPEKLLATLRPHQLRDVLLHECAHVLRRDHVLVLLQQLASILYWFHPLIHWLNRQLSRAREEICDNYVLRAADAPSYSRTLLELSERTAGSKPLTATIGISLSKWQLEDRVAGLLDTRRNPMTRLNRKSTLAVSTFTLVLGGAMLLSCVGMGRNTNELDFKPSPVEEKQKSADKKGRVGAKPDASDSMQFNVDLVDGARLTGKPGLSVFKLKPTLSPVDRIIRKASSEIRDAWSVEFRNGDKLTGTLSSGTAEFACPLGKAPVFKVQETLGELKIPIALVSTMKRSGSEKAWSVRFRNGDRLTGALGLETLEVQTVFGAVSVGMSHVSAMHIVRIVTGRQGPSITDGLVAYYAFDGNTDDNSGHRHNGTVHGAVLTQDRLGRPDRAYLFDGDDYIDLGSDPEMQTHEFTVAAWIRASPESRWQAILSYQKGSHAVHVQGGRVYYGGQWIFQEGVHGTTIVTGEWTFITVTRDADKRVTVYVNGKAENSRVCDIHSSFQNNAIIGGDVLDGEYFDGAIDEVMIFDRPLLDVEVAELYRSQDSRN